MGIGPSGRMEKQPMLKQGTKHDQGKPRWELLPLNFLRETVEVLTLGAKEHGDWNWQEVENGEDRYYAALIRHLDAYRSGKDIDPQYGKHHLAHAMCNLIFMLFFAVQRRLKNKDKNVIEALTEAFGGNSG